VTVYLSGTAFFDVVTLIETLEHVPDYVSCLRECHRVLRERGVLFIQSARCLNTHICERDETHFHALEPACLSRLLDYLKFKVLEMGQVGENFYIVAEKVTVKY